MKPEEKLYNIFDGIKDKIPFEPQVALILGSGLGNLADKLDIVDVISGYVRIQKKGSNYMGLCPFHNEKTPSFYEYPDKYYPFDWDAYFNSGQKFVMVVSNCITGKAEYVEEYKDGERLLKACMASCTLPFSNPITYLDGKPMLDGGVCDAVPIQYLIDKGFEKFVIVLTRPKGYRKPLKKVWLPFFVYSKYPKLREALRGRAQRYNRAMDLIDELEEQGRAIVIRPKAPMKVSRAEKDTQKLNELYREGLEYNLEDCI